MDEAEKEQRLETELTYAWNWFQYHAGQRLTAFNFFLVIVGVVAVAFTKALEKGWTVLGAVVGGLGALISIGFLFLDVRNEELVNCGRAALAELERGLRVHPSGDAGDRTHLKLGTPGTFRGHVTRSRGWAGWIAHRRWLRLIEGTVAIAFVVGAIWAATGFAGLEGPAKRAQATAARPPGPNRGRARGEVLACARDNNRLPSLAYPLDGPATPGPPCRGSILSDAAQRRSAFSGSRA